MAVLPLVQPGATYATYVVVSYVLFYISYQIFLHPLKKFPGPVLARLSHWYGGYHSLKKRFAYVIYADHHKYGPVVRVGPDRLVFNTAAAVHDIYQNPRVNKSSLYELSRVSALATTFDTIDVEEHRRKRKMVSQPLADRRLATFEPVMVEYIDRFIDLIGKSDGPVNMSDWCRNLGGDVMAQLAYGYNLNLLTEETNQWLLPGLMWIIFRINLVMNFPGFKRIDPLVKYLLSDGSTVDTMVKARIALDRDAKHDFYSIVADQLRVGDSLQQGEVWTEAFLYLSAGGNTTTTTMTALLFYLSRYPGCYKKLADEVRSTFNDMDEIQSGDKMRQCHYLRACINEALRIATPNPAVLWREQLDSDPSPLFVDGHSIPRGTHVGVSLFALHHNEKYWPDPFAFKPERWLEGGQEEMLHRAFSPFSVGAHSCPGKSMAYQELSIFLARLLWQLDFEPAPGELGRVGEVVKNGKRIPNEFEMSDMFNAGHDGPYLEFHKRQTD